MQFEWDPNKAAIHRKNALLYKTGNGAHVGDIYMTLIYTTERARDEDVRAADSPAARNGMMGTGTVTWPSFLVLVRRSIWRTVTAEK
ncbi:MAG: hypothetical protein ACE5I7_03145 [Candidatus Binatia bacterium]